MNLKSIFWGLTLFLTSGSLLHAQTITGRVVEADGGEPLPFVNIAILQLPDSTLVTGAVSDDDGRYTLTLPETSASLLLNASSIGYRSLTLPVRGSDLSVLRLQADAALLNEVVVTGKRVVTHRFENNGISTDIDVSPLRTLGTALDVLGQLPFIYKDGDEISVLGRGTPLIYINNRLVRDMNEVKQLRSEQIKKVLVITNPGAEYDSTVSAVIRITTVKGQGEGWSGTSSATGILNRKYNITAQQDLNYRTGEWDFFGMGYLYSGKALEYMDFEQETPKRETADTKILSRFSVRQYVPIQNVYARGGFNKSFGDEGNFGARYTFSRTIPQMAGLY
ncbi:MAG: carboxypeptidase-like regulatory domain-containing protein, partial [Prevotellaceae bacterium]|nr:carboxypeptidase-like regulatory domain-containing protein [Prevotellaceae bacterium]